MTPEDLVAACDATLRPLETAANAGWWESNVAAGEDNRRRRAEAEIALSDALADPDVFAEIRAARATPGLDPLIARQLEILDQTFTPKQVPADLRREIVELETDIESRFARHRGVVAGIEVDDNDILDVLRTSDDSEHRAAAWAASKTVGAEVAADLGTLIGLRNQAAEVLGARDHFALTLATTEFDETRLFATLAEIDEITAAPFRALKIELDEQLASRFSLPVGDLRPWHYEDPFFQETPSAIGVDLDPYLRTADLEALTARTFDSMGLDVRAVLARSDLTPREHKVQHAFCIDIDRAGDVRVLCNNVPSARWTETMLHEFGHAVYFDGVDRDLPWLLRTMHLCVTEGVAMRCGRLVNDPDWLSRIAGVPDVTVAELAPKLRAAARAQLLIFARWVLVMTHFERGLYADPTADHDTRWWDLVERFQLVHRPDDRKAPDWAAKIHIVAAPVYYHNYLFGELVASQLLAAFGNLVDNPEAGRALGSRVFGPGATRRWDHLIEHATGSPLSPAAFARELAG